MPAQKLPPSKSLGTKQPIKRLDGDRVDISDHADTLDSFNDFLMDIREAVDTAIAKQFKAAISEAIEAAMEQYETGASLAAAWSDAEGNGDGHTPGNQPKRYVDPLAVYLDIALAAGGDTVTYVFDLRAAVRNDIEYADEYRPGLTRIMVAMRELADEIDAALRNR